jgi:hypothetical protein
MGYHLVHVNTNEKIRWYQTRKGARIAMRVSNRNAGFQERMSWGGIIGKDINLEIENCRGTMGFLAPQHTYAKGPYGIVKE